MCVCHRHAAEAGLTGYLAGDVLERWARHALIDERELLASRDVPSPELARRLHVPVAQVVAAREEIDEPDRFAGGPELPRVRSALPARSLLTGLGLTDVGVGGQFRGWRPMTPHGEAWREEGVRVRFC